jgi:hypothetical protein
MFLLRSDLWRILVELVYSVEAYLALVSLKISRFQDFKVQERIEFVWKYGWYLLHCPDIETFVCSQIKIYISDK